MSPVIPRKKIHPRGTDRSIDDQRQAIASNRGTRGEGGGAHPCERTKRAAQETSVHICVDDGGGGERHRSFELPGRRFFFITVRADCIFFFTSLCGRGGGVQSVEESNVERGPSNHLVFPAIVRLPRSMASRPLHLGRNPGKERRGRWAKTGEGDVTPLSVWGTRSPFLSLPPFLHFLSSPLFSLLSPEIALSPPGRGSPSSIASLGSVIKPL